MATEVGSTDLESSGPVELDQLQFDLNGMGQNGDTVPESSEGITARGDNSEPSVLSSLIPLDTGSSTSDRLFMGDADGLEVKEDTIEQVKEFSLPDIVSDGLVVSRNVEKSTPLDLQLNIGNISSELSDENGREEQYQQSAESEKVLDLDEHGETQISLKESVRSLKDVMIESGPVPENTRPLDLVQTAKNAGKESEDSGSEFEDEYAEQEVVQKSDSESDNEFEVPDRPEQVSQNNQGDSPKANLNENDTQSQSPASVPVDSEASSLSVRVTVPQPSVVSVTSSESTTKPYVQSDIIQVPVCEIPSTQSPQSAHHLLSKSIPAPVISHGLPSISASSATVLPEQQSQNEKIESPERLQRAPEVQASDDWDKVATIQAEFAENKEKSAGPGKEPAPAYSSPLLSVSDAVQHFRQADLSAVKPKVHISVERHGFSALAHFLFGPPKLHRDLQSDRELVFLIAGSQLNNEESIHVRILQSIYRILTGSKFDCQRFGSHWEEIGFQGIQYTYMHLVDMGTFICGIKPELKYGRDPGTDIRGVGMLGLVQLLFFLRNPKSAQLARDLYKLSLHPTQNFPFCVMGINVSRICLQTLREDLINKECNKRRAVIEVVNDLYVGTYLQLYKIWRQGKTISDSGHVLTEVETFAKKNTKSVFKNLEEYFKQKPSRGADVTVEEGQEEFLSVCKVEADE